MTTLSRLQAGATLGRYTVERVVPLDEIQATLYLLRHELGARHAHIERNDDNNAFAVFFPTVPKDDTGVAHILEHIALMGSRKYPVSDPFFSMIPRSLNTFMNAMTAPDWTTYLYTTRNTRDYFNLLDIYLDAAFFPLLREESFLRDGHRFEFAEAGNKSSELKLQGVVYNEMKGAMASAASIMSKALSRGLYPDLTYANNSGGDPDHIPDLSYAALKAFHAAHYHPSNAYFYTYGNLPLAQILDTIEASVLKDFGPNPLDVSIPDQTPFAEPRSVVARYPGSDTERGAQALLAWKLGRSSDPDHNLLWSILSEVLVGNPAAPLYKRLIDSGLGSGLANYTGYNDSFREGMFAAGLQGLSADKAAAVQALVLESLEQIAQEGVAPELIDSAIHQFEIAQKEVSNAGWPYGFRLGFRMLGPWLHGGDPVDGLRLDEALERFQARRAAGGLLEGTIRRELLDNPHRLALTLVPDPVLAEQSEQIERERVQRLSQELDEAARDRIVEQAVALQALQDVDDDHSVLPTLGLGDVTRTVSRPPYSTEQVGGSVVGRVEQPTSGLVYLDVQLRLPELSGDELNLLPLYASFVTRSGAAGQDYVALTRRTEAVSGGVSASAGVGTGPADLGDLRVSLSFSGKALARNAGELVTLMSDLIARPEFSPERTEQLLRQRATGMRNSLSSSAPGYAGQLAAAQVSPSAALGERMDGLPQLERMEALVNGGDFAGLSDRLQALGRRLLSAQSRICLTASAPDLGLDLTPVTAVLAGSEAPARPAPALAPHVPQARTIDTPVNYNAAAWQTVPYTHPDSPALLALSRLLSSKYLLRELREKGGAYGGAASLDMRGGDFTMRSWRDPNVARTFGVFQQAAEFLDSVDGDRELTEAILTASKNLDPLTSPDTAGRSRFFGDLAGYTPEVQETYIARLLAVTLDDLKRVMRQYLTPERAAYAVVTGRDPGDDTAELGLKFESRAV